ncbi:hypothetical protein FRACYDRAFT_248006 [Fragilariopsis cylindrus CCMP1102]|uniref:Uncharacterized protein n=1 Tax=Fragilariopsis cylindrus CCMP1102 TaxID=635003 RepID=A0A1E7EV65_9STRA|nr:hypothetical protein FRACYDRAFT_248006 [Fragilariopsis cylindrus CCMP1102]|eukprot:OEU09749.1 hypothetical protein FRACYDRAFT_248006 [Fragilariopsis cylindrus CCMP1102]
MGRDLQEEEEKIIFPITAPTLQPTGSGTTELSPSSSSFIGNSNCSVGGFTLPPTSNTVSTRPNIGRINTEDEEPPNDNAILVLTDIPTLPPTSQATVQVGGFTLPPKSSPEESTSPNTGPVNPEGEEPHQDNTTIVLLPPILQAVVDNDDHIVTIISDNDNSDIGRTVDGSGSTIQPQPPSVKLPSFNTWQKNKQSTSGTTVLLRGTLVVATQVAVDYLGILLLVEELTTHFKE